MTSGPTWIEQFPGNFVWSNAALVTKGMAPYGAVALGEIDEVAHKLFAAVGSARKHLKIFTAADGGTYHAQADNRQVGVDYIADWISAHV